MSPELAEKKVHQLLNADFWLPSINVMEGYTRVHDDHDGSMTGIVQIMFGRDGDAHLSTDKHMGASLRFRMPLVGGGQSKRVRTALLILAEAIRLDNEERPQTRELPIPK